MTSSGVQSTGSGSSSRLVIRAARVAGDYVEADIRECRRRESELRQQSIIASRTPHGPDLSNYLLGSSYLH